MVGEGCLTLLQRHSWCILQLTGLITSGEKYQVEWKVLQYFGNLRHNLVALKVFAEVVVTTLLDCRMPNSPDTLHVLFFRFATMTSRTALESSFMLTGLCLISDVLAAQAKFLQPPGYCTVINRAFTFHTTKVFDCFHSIMAQFEVIKLTFPK